MTLIEYFLIGDTASLEFFEAVEQASPEDVAAVLALVDHDDAEIRRSVAAALPHFEDREMPTPDLVEALIRLTRDDDPRVRDWACFSLGRQCRELDSATIRDALVDRLEDEDHDARTEALAGLAYRRDPRALAHVQAALSRPEDDVWILEIEAAGALGDPCLYELVLGHLEGWDDPDAQCTVQAVRRLTDPAGPGQDLFEGVADISRRRAHHLPGEDLTSWSLMAAMLDIAPDLAQEFLNRTAECLADDPAALNNLLTQSALTSMTAR